MPSIQYCRINFPLAATAPVELSATILSKLFDDQRSPVASHHRHYSWHPTPRGRARRSFPSQRLSGIDRIHMNERIFTIRIFKLFTVYQLPIVSPSPHGPCEQCALRILTLQDEDLQLCIAKSGIIIIYYNYAKVLAGQLV